MNPVRPHSFVIRPDRLPVPVKDESKAVVPVGPTDAGALVVPDDAQRASAGPALVASPMGVTAYQGGAPEASRQAHAAADQSYRRTMALDWGVHRTIDFEA